MGRLWRGLMGAVLWILLTACSGAVPDGGQAGVVRLTLWQGINPPPNREVFQQLVDKFNRTHPQIQVENLYVGQADQQMPKILAAVVGDAKPDLLWYSPTVAGKLVELGAIEPLDRFWKASAVTAQIDRALDSSAMYQQQRWSVPFATNNLGIFYRPSLFRAAGITQLPQTWVELRQAAQQLTQGERRGIQMPLGKGEWTVFSWLPFMWSGGGELTSGAIKLDQPGAIAALEFWDRLVKDGSVILSLPERGYELDRFLAGRVAMQITGPWTLGQLASTGVDYGVMPIPRDKAAHTVVGGESLFMMRNRSGKEAAAWAFMEYILGEDFQTNWAVGTGYLPVNLLARKSDPYRAYVAKTPALQVFLDQAPRGRARPIDPEYNEISENLGRAIEAVLLQRAPPAAALAEAQHRWQLAQ